MNPPKIGVDFGTLNKLINFTLILIVSMLNDLNIPNSNTPKELVQSSLNYGTTVFTYRLLLKYFFHQHFIADARLKSIYVWNLIFKTWWLYASFFHHAQERLQVTTKVYFKGADFSDVQDLKGLYQDLNSTNWRDKLAHGESPDVLC